MTEVVRICRCARVNVCARVTSRSPVVPELRLRNTNSSTSVLPRTSTPAGKCRR
ncbi:hypothetical protein [Actinophytocola sp.]|uniref:hypothetical protein n=1 Tax=Actinophytocola sp. TaxID=1872138 RepID=UPI0025BF42AA|nr:hypothetical protein [Actinophytocola sp.]